MARLRYTTNDETGCWEWTGSISDTGYGVVWHEGKLQLAHRVVYELNVGKIQDEYDIDHLCRNHRCVNPKHLEPVTRAENARRGIGTKLTIDQVREILELHKNGLGCRRLGRMFGVHKNTILEIFRGRNWKDVSLIREV